MAFKATADPDALNLRPAMSAPDSEPFQEEMLKEVRDHEKRGHWELIKKSLMPVGARILPAVWSFKRKRDIISQAITRWRSRLNVGGHKQVPGEDFDSTFSPTVAWPTIRLFMAFFLMNKWVTKQLDLVLAYPHADVERPTFMKIPHGFSFEGSSNDYVLKLKKNLYGQRQAARVYFLFLRDYLVNLGFTQSKVDPCVFYGTNCVILVYVDDLIIGAKTDQDLNNALELLNDNIDLENKGSIDDYVGVHVTHFEDRIELTQPHLIESVLKDLRLDGSDCNTSPTPTVVGQVLHPDEDGTDFDNHFNYRSVCGKLNYISKCSRPDIAFATHQCCRYMANPKQSHATAIKRIGRYLLLTKDKGLILKPDKTKSFECFVDASFLGEWKKERADKAMFDPDTARSRTGYVIFFAGVPLIWSSKLQVEVCLSSTEAEMVALSAATRECIFLIRLLREAFSTSSLNFDIANSKIHCGIFEDNTGTLELVKEFRIRPRTKHMNSKFWHFTTFMEANKDILTFHWIDTKSQVSDMLTKALGGELFSKFVKAICGWSVPTSHSSSIKGSRTERGCDDGQTDRP